MNFLYGLVSVVLSMVLFSILFNALNMSVLHLFCPFQKLTSKLKRKKLYYGIIAIILIIFSVFIKDSFNLNYIENGIVLGMLISLNDMIFDTGVKEKLNS